MNNLRVIDSHTEGEPTRLVIEGGPELGSGTMAERLHLLQSKHDSFRSAVVNEPRGSDALVGALLCTPVRADSAAGVIYFNNVGFLGMCGHGTIGLVASLAFLGIISPGTHRIETPVGDVYASLMADGSVSIANVRSYRYQKGVRLEVSGYGVVVGEIAYGGNWFFLVGESNVPVNFAHIEELSQYAKAIKRALVSNAITGADGAEIDHIEIFAAPELPDAHSKNFVLCPGGAYDRSPCGTGLSAKLACLAAEGKLAEGEEWRQESVIGTLFRGSYRQDGDGVLPTISGRAFVTADNTLLFEESDPLKHGISI